MDVNSKEGCCRSDPVSSPRLALKSTVENGTVAANTTIRRPSNSSPPSQLRLCDRCQTPDWDSILTPLDRGLSSDSLEVIEYPQPGGFDTSHCDVCSFFWDATQIEAENEVLTADISLYSNTSYSPTGYIDNWKRFPEEGVQLILGPSKHPKEAFHLYEKHGYVMPVVAEVPGKALIRARKLGAKIDFNILRGWMETCHSIHPSHRDRPYEHNITHLRLLDCRSLQVVSATSTAKYLALSYVWGDTTLHSNRLDASKLPRLIHDAVKVTVELGFDYLWVDRYCIPQDDPVQMQHHLNAMHKIYKNAEATIIAAAGEDPSHGLPGVGSGPPRTPQPSIQIGAHTLVYTFPPPQTMVARSRWASRAWVYQEALLSRRRLYFTAHQAHFECDHVHAHESVDACPALLSRERESGDFFGRNDLEPVARNDARQKIEVFARRRLTFDADGLAAMLGILREYEELPHPTLHFGGVPINQGRWVDLDSVSEFVRGLRWRHPRPARRRVGDGGGALPSWSWAGWEGEVEYYDHLAFEAGVERVEAEDRRGRRLPLVHVLETKMLNEGVMPESITYCLHLRVWTVKLWFRPLPQSGQGENRRAEGVDDLSALYAVARPDAEPKPYLRLSLSKDVGEGGFAQRLRQESWDCILLGQTFGGKMRNAPLFLVVEWQGVTAERIGCLRLRASDGIWQPDKIRDKELDDYIGIHKQMRSIRLG